MDVREKLVELIFDSLCRHIDKSCKLAENIADDLLSNGVTVQEWISVKDRLPDSNGQYIVTACDEGCAAGEGIWYDTVVVTAEYYNGCWTWYEGGHEYDLDGIVTHWMPIPEPPQK